MSRKINLFILFLPTEVEGCFYYYDYGPPSHRLLAQNILLRVVQKFIFKITMDGGKFSVEKLRSGGYETWRFKVEMLLVRENLWKYVSEAAPNPLTDAWKEGDAKARATIALLVDDCQHPLIRDSKTAQSTWDNIKNHHQKTTMTTKVSLLKKLCRAEYNENGDMEGHLFKMEELFSSLANAGQELDANLKVAMVLKSMPDSFDNLTTALETREDKNLTMDLVKGKLLDEAQKRMEKTHPSESILQQSAHFWKCGYRARTGRETEEARSKGEEANIRRVCR